MVQYPSKNKQSNKQAYTEFMTALMELTCFGKPLDKSGLLQNVVNGLKQVNYSKEDVLDHNSYATAFVLLLLEDRPDLLVTIMNDPTNEAFKKHLQTIDLLSKKKVEDLKRIINPTIDHDRPRPRGKAGKS